MSPTRPFSPILYSITRSMIFAAKHSRQPILPQRGHGTRLSSKQVARSELTLPHEVFSPGRSWPHRAISKTIWHHGFVNTIIVQGLLFSAVMSVALADGLPVTHSDVVQIPDIPQPGYLASYIDPVLVRKSRGSRENPGPISETWEANGVWLHATAIPKAPALRPFLDSASLDAPYRSCMYYHSHD